MSLCEAQLQPIISIREQLGCFLLVPSSTRTKVFDGQTWHCQYHCTHRFSPLPGALPLPASAAVRPPLLLCSEPPLAPLPTLHLSSLVPSTLWLPPLINRLPCKTLSISPALRLISPALQLERMSNRVQSVRIIHLLWWFPFTALPIFLTMLL